MAIDKKLIHFKTWNTFISNQGVNNNYTTPSSGTAGSGSALYGQIKETSIVFIQDVQKIWTHGKLYDCSSPDLSNYVTSTELNALKAIVTTSADGLVPKADGSIGTLSDAANHWVLSRNGNTIDWYKLPANAFKNDNDDTHYISKNIVGTSATAITNGAVTGTGGVFLNHLEESTVQSSHKIVGSGTVKVTSDANGNITITGTDANTAHSHDVGVGLVGSGNDGTSGTYTYKAKLRSETNDANDSSATDSSNSNRLYPVKVDKSGYLAVNVPWKNDDTKSFTITASADDDDVVVLSGTDGTNATTYTASHAKTFGNTTAPYVAKYTSGSSTTSISGYGATATIKIPQITVDEYGHVRAGEDESITITMPSEQTLPTIPTTLKNPESLSFGSKTYDGSTPQTITAADLGIDSALKFHGTSSTAITDGSTTKTVTLSTGKSHTAENGCVLFYGNKEFVWNGSSWEELGNEGDYKVKQTDVSSPSANGSTTAFIDTISQDANGVITVTKKNLAAATDSVIGGLKLYNAAKTTAVTPNAATTTNNRYYAVELDKDGKAFINVPWTDTDTNTTYSAGTGLGLSNTKFNLETASKTEIGGIKVADVLTTGITSSDGSIPYRFYGVQVDKHGLAFVNVPWTDTIIDTNTHWTTRLYAGASGTAANAAADNPYLKVTDDNTYRNQVQFAGAGTVSVASDANGKITITGSAHPTSLPASDVYSWAKASSKPTYNKSEVGLGNVDNTADSAKSVKSATQLTTARTIWGQSFNGTGNVSGSMTGVSDITMSGNIKMGDATISYDSSEKCIKFSF